MTKDEIIALAREAEVSIAREYGEPIPVECLERFAKLVAKHEREQCAKVCDGLGDAATIGYAGLGAIYCAEAIRARKEQANG